MATSSILRPAPNRPTPNRHASRALPNGLTPGERQIMALWDNGLSCMAIDRQLGLRRGKAADIVSIYHEGNETRLAKNNMITGSQALASAIQLARAA